MSNSPIKLPPGSIRAGVVDNNNNFHETLINELVLMLSGNQTVSGQVTFASGINVSGTLSVDGSPILTNDTVAALSGNLQDLADSVVLVSGDQSVSGVKTFEFIEVSGTSSEPGVNYLGIDASSLTEKGISYKEDGEIKWQNYIWHDEKGEFFYLWNDPAQIDAAVVSDEGRFGFNKQTNYLLPFAAFSGTGLNDIVVGGVYMHDVQQWFEVRVTATGAADSFTYRISSDGVSWTAYSGSTFMTGTVQDLTEDVTVTFLATTGHTVGDSWKFVAFPQNPQATFSVAPKFVDYVLYAADFNSPVYEGRTYLANSAMDPFLALSGANGALYVGGRTKFNALALAPWEGSTASGTPVLDYWNGSGWTEMQTGPNRFLDRTEGFKRASALIFDKESLTDWSNNLSLVRSDNLYWVRLRSATPLASPLWLTAVHYASRRYALYSKHLSVAPDLLVEADGKVTIGHSLLGNESNSILHIEGSTGSKLEVVTADKTLGIFDNTIICDSPNVITISLPDSARCRGRRYGIKKFNTGNVIIKPYGTQLIDGHTQLIITNKGKTYELISDGADWYIYVEGSKAKVGSGLVEGLYDFPLPVSGVIYLVPNTSYQIEGRVNIGTNRIVAASGNNIVGSAPDYDMLIYTGSGAMITVAGSSINLKSVGISCTDSGSRVLDAQGATVSGERVNSVMLDSCFFGTVSGCAKVANLSNLQWVIIKDCGFQNCTQGLTVSGASHLTVGRNVFDHNADGMVGLELLDGTYNIATIFGNQFNLASNQTALKIPNLSTMQGAAISENVFVQPSGVTGATALSGGLTHDNVYWQIKGNFGLRDHRILGFLTFEANTLSVTTTDLNSYYKAEGVNDVVKSERMDCSVDNRIRNLNLVGRDFSVFVTGAVSVSQNAQTLRVALYKYDAALGTSSRVAENEVRAVTAGESNAFSLNTVVSMQLNDYLEVWVRNTTSNNKQVKVEYMQFKVTD